MECAGRVFLAHVALTLVTVTAAGAGDTAASAERGDVTQLYYLENALRRVISDHLLPHLLQLEREAEEEYDSNNNNVLFADDTEDLPVFGAGPVVDTALLSPLGEPTLDKRAAYSGRSYYDRKMKRYRYSMPRYGTYRPRCDTSRITRSMFVSFLRTGSLCGRRVTHLRYGLTG